MLDRLLRQREGFFEEIFNEPEIWPRMRTFLLAILGLSAVYGLAMGAAGLLVDWQRGFLQMVASGVKVPMLYLLSVGVCFPVLYIVVVLMGSRLSFLQTLSLILLALTLNALLLVSCAPIVFFFLVTGADYHFVKLLHVVIFTFSGVWAMIALWQGLKLMCEKSDLYTKQALRILQVWILVFCFGGTQMAWSLRPFVGSPGEPFEWVRENREMNFYKAVWVSVVGLASDNQQDRSESPTNPNPGSGRQ
jgi:hypothetical protein